MPEYGLTDSGFLKKPLSEIVADLEAGWHEIFGAEADTSPDSPDGQLIGLIAGAAEEVWSASGEIVSAFDPQAARGALLSALVQLNGISRRDGTKSVVLVVAGGTPTTVIPIGSMVRNDDGDLLVAIVGGTISGAGTAAVFFEAVEEGPVVVDAGSINEIVTPVAGWDTVTVNTTGVLGTLEETDTALRRRREISTENGATSVIAALYGALRAIDGVLDVNVVENKTLSTDGLGVPGKSFMAVVDGGTDADVAEAVWDKHPMGIASHGATTETVTDSEGVSQDVKFQRPADIDIYVEMTIVAGPDFPADGDDLIKQAIVDFAAGNLSGHTSHRFGIGDDVEYSRLYTAINSVPGHTVSVLTIGTAPSPVGTANIAITGAQVSRWDTSDIVVNS